MGERSAHHLEPDGIVDTVDTLRRRISERFPNAGLLIVCAELVEIARKSGARAEQVGRPNLLLRAATFVVLGLALWGCYLILLAVGPTALAFFLNEDGVAFIDAAQALDSVVNLLIVAGVALWSIVSLEATIKRRRALERLNELRSHAHVVDMRQLNKDPISIRNPLDRTESSPEREMTPFELARYLTYCTEMLSLIGKLAELYAENTSDSRIIAAANDVELLCGAISRKIWQKLMILSQADYSEAVMGGDPTPR